MTQPRSMMLPILALLVAAIAPMGADVASAGPPAGVAAKAAPDFGPNVIIFDPSMPVGDIQATVDAIHAQQVNDEMGANRYALLFKPGVYGSGAQPLQIKVGYYTEVAGLGASPADVTINGKIEVYNRCLDNGGTSNCLALRNSWRSVSNLSLIVNGTGQDGCRASGNFWAVARGASMRRVDMSGGNLSLMDYCTGGPQFASGGFIADSNLPFVINGAQQQWLTRNSQIGGWSNGVWTQVFAGVEGAPSDADFPNPPYTTLDTTPASREKPYLFLDDQGKFNVRVPSAQTDSRGTSWAGGLAAGRTIPLRDFFVARPSDSATTINSQLARGKHLLLTPGVYDVDRSIAIKKADTVVLGMGHATLTSLDGAVAVTIADVGNVVVAGLVIDAGEAESPSLMQVGKAKTKKGPRTKIDPAKPTTLSDVVFRVGGPHVGKAGVALEINSDGVLIDNAWLWRADRGAEAFADDTERWNTNVGRRGIVVDGSDVIATGLFAEHFQEYNAVWSGESGRTVLFQGELAPDAPTQADWMNGGVEGWAAYKVEDPVTAHRLDGGIVSVNNRNDPSIHTENGFEVPQTAGVRLHHIATVNLGAGTIDHVVNGVGGAADTSAIGVPVAVVDYP